MSTTHLRFHRPEEEWVRSYLEVFEALNGAGVRYVVVGGVAVVLQGHVRMTVDLDLVVDLAPERLLAVLDLLADRGFRPRLPVDPQDFADPAVRATWVAERNLQVFSLYCEVDPLSEIDLFATYPLPFEDLLEEADQVVVGQVRVPVASLSHLIRLKRAAARPRDLEDVEALTLLQQQRGSS